MGHPRKSQGIHPTRRGWVHPASGRGESLGKGTRWGRGRAVPEGLRLHLRPSPSCRVLGAAIVQGTGISPLRPLQVPLAPVSSPPMFPFKVQHAHALVSLRSVNSIARLPVSLERKLGCPGEMGSGESKGPAERWGAEGSAARGGEAGGCVPPPRWHQGCVESQLLRGAPHGEGGGVGWPGGAGTSTLFSGSRQSAHAHLPTRPPSPSVQASDRKPNCLELMSLFMPEVAKTTPWVLIFVCLACG